jgi:hypothetical protein
MGKRIDEELAKSKAKRLAKEIEQQAKLDQQAQQQQNNGPLSL